MPEAHLSAQVWPRRSRRSNARKPFRLVFAGIEPIDPDIVCSRYGVSGGPCSFHGVDFRHQLSQPLVSTLRGMPSPAQPSMLVGPEPAGDPTTTLVCSRATLKKASTVQRRL